MILNCLEIIKHFDRHIRNKKQSVVQYTKKHGLKNQGGGLVCQDMTQSP